MSGDTPTPAFNPTFRVGPYGQKQMFWNYEAWDVFADAEMQCLHCMPLHADSEGNFPEHWYRLKS